MADKKVLENILNEYSKLYTCAVSDAIDELGYNSGFIDSEYAQCGQVQEWLATRPP